MTATARRQVHLDTDLGIGNDDFQALMLALLSDAITVTGVSVCAGNLTMRQSSHNAISVLAVMGRSDVPVFAGDPMPLVHEYGAVEARAFGAWGAPDPPVWPLGFVPDTTPCGPARSRLARLLRDGTDELICLGPLTSLARATREVPAAHRSGVSVICMGGAFSEIDSVPGNAPNGAEFNFWVDPEAADLVLGAALPMTIVPWNLGVRMTFRGEDLRALAAPSNPQGDLYSVVDNTLRDAGAPHALEGCDLLAVAYLLWPELFEARRGHVRVVGDSRAPGAGSSTFAEDPGGPHKLLVSADLSAVRESSLNIMTCGRDRARA